MDNRAFSAVDDDSVFSSSLDRKKIYPRLQLEPTPRTLSEATTVSSSWSDLDAGSTQHLPVRPSSRSRRDIYKTRDGDYPYRDDYYPRRDERYDHRDYRYEPRERRYLPRDANYDRRDNRYRDDRYYDDRYLIRDDGYAARGDPYRDEIYPARDPYYSVNDDFYTASRHNFIATGKHRRAVQPSPPNPVPGRAKVVHQLPPPPGNQTPGVPSVTAEPVIDKKQKPKTYIALAILSFFFNPVCGLCAICLSVKTKLALRKGNIAAASSDSKLTLGLSILSLIAGPCLILYIWVTVWYEFDNSGIELTTINPDPHYQYEGRPESAN